MTEAAGRGRTLGPGQAIACGAAIVGVLDFLYPTLRTVARGRPWFVPWQGVASALLGSDAFTGGASAIALGIVCHFIVATCVVAAYVSASRWIPALSRHAVPLGMAYGLWVFFFMNWVVIPLTRIGRVPTFTTDALVLGLLVHVFLIGLPAALVARRVDWRRPTQPHVPS
jgi:hypothetical protein